MSAARITLLRLATAVLAVFAVALALSDLVDLVVAARTGAPLAQLVNFGLSISAWGLGLSTLALVIVWRVSDREEAFIAALVFGSLAAIFSGVRFDPTGPATASEVIPRVILGGFTYSIAVRFGQLFPRPLEASTVLALGRRRVSRALLRIPAALLTPALFWPAMAVMELIVHGFQTTATLVLHVLVYVGLAMFYLYVGYRAGCREDRRRLFWLFEGALVLFILEVTEALAYSARALGIFSAPLERWSAWLWPLEGWVALLCFSLAVFHSGALDSRLVLRKTAILSASGMVALVLFVAVEELVSELAAGLLGVGSSAGTLFAGVLAALAFRPLTERVDRLLLVRTDPRGRAPAAASDPLEGSGPE